MQRRGFVTDVKKQKRSRFGLCVLLLAALLVFSLVKLEQKIRPVARVMAEYECKERAVRWMQSAVADCLRDTPELLEDLYLLQYDSAGRVQSAEADASRLAQLQYMLESDLTQSMEEGAADFSVPLGTLLGLQLFAHIFILGQPFYGFALRKAACHVHAGQRRPGAAGRAVGNAFHTGPSCAGYCAACSSCASSARQPASIWAYAVSKSRVYQGSAMSPGVPV